MGDKNQIWYTPFWQYVSYKIKWVVVDRTIWLLKINVFTQLVMNHRFIRFLPREHVKSKTPEDEDLLGFLWFSFSPRSSVCRSDTAPFPPEQKVVFPQKVRFPRQRVYLLLYIPCKRKHVHIKSFFRVITETNSANIYFVLNTAIWTETGSVFSVLASVPNDG